MKLLRDIIFIIAVLLLTSVDNKVSALSSFSFQQVTKQTDTVKKKQTDTAKKNNLKKSDLDQKLEYKAADSIRIDRKKNIMYLYGKARVIYDDFELDAEYIKFDQKNNTIFASGVKNEKGKYIGRPIFKSGAEGSAIADSLAFNTVTKKAIISNIFKEQEGGYFSGGKAKVQPDREIHSLGQTYSTCNLPEPHYGLHFTKAIVTENQIITGPVYMEFEKIPLPLALPFAFFPKPNKKSSGIMLPTFTEDGIKGFALTNGGYYLSLNDYWDTRIMGDIYTNGSYHINTTTNYTKRYKFNGSFGFSYTSDRQGLEGTPQYDPQKNFHLDWSHSQNANANPGTTFSASVSAGTANFFTTSAAFGTYNIDQIAQNTLQSSISYGKVFGDGLFNLTTALTHSQETQSKTIALSLPKLSLSMSSISPFASKTNLGTPKWYEKITVSYTLQAENTVNTKENLLFDKGGLRRFTNGMQHNIPVSLPFNLFQYLNFNAGVNYNEFWYLQTTKKRYIQQPGLADSIAVDTLNGFKRAADYGLSMSMSTKIYGKKEFKHLGNIMAIRHVMTPNIGFSYRPDFSTKNYYKDQVYYTNDIRPGKSIPINNNGSEILRDRNGKPLRYSIFENGIYGGPSAGRSASLNFSVDNNVELKVRDSKDTTGKGEKKIPIIQGLTISSAYNFVSDSLKLAPINFGGRSQFTDKLGFNFSGAFSPYVVRNVGTTYTSGTTTTTTFGYREIDRYLWKDGKLPRLTNFNFSFDYSLNPEAVKAKNKNMDALNNQANQSGRTPEQAEQLAAISRDPNAFVDFNIPWNFTFSYAFNYNNPLGIASPDNITNTLTFSGDANVTSKWKVEFRSGYDFKAKNLAYTSFAIYRDLHCWDLSASWVPFGLYQSYSIDIRVKASILQDLKLSKRKGYETRF